MMYLPMQPEIVEGPSIDAITTSDGSIYIPSWNGDHVLATTPEGQRAYTRKVFIIVLKPCVVKGYATAQVYSAATPDPTQQVR